MNSPTDSHQLHVVSHQARLPNGFELLAYTGADGTTVVEIDTNGASTLHHDSRTEPYVRVYVNEGLVHDHSPTDPLPGSDNAQGERCDECGQRIPDHPGGQTANRHHDPACTLHDPHNQ